MSKSKTKLAETGFSIRKHCDLFGTILIMLAAGIAWFGARAEIVTIVIAIAYVVRTQYKEPVPTWTDCAEAMPKVALSPEDADYNRSELVLFQDEFGNISAGTYRKHKRLKGVSAWFESNGLMIFREVVKWKEIL